MRNQTFNHDLALVQAGNSTVENLRFVFGDKKEAQLTVNRLNRRRVKSLKLEIDSREFWGVGGIDWYDWLVPMLGNKFSLKLIFEKSPSGSGNFPSEKNRALSEVVEYFILKHGKYFSEIELFRGEENRGQTDQEENIFSDEVVFAATWAKYLGKKVVLRGNKTLDHDWVLKLNSFPISENFEFADLDKESVRKSSPSESSFGAGRQIQPLGSYTEKISPIPSQVLSDPKQFGNQGRIGN